MSPGRAVGVTGAGGYVGSVVCRALVSAGLDVVGLVRAGLQTSTGSRLYDLAEEPGATVLDGLDALVLCAWDLHLTNYSDIWRVNVEGTNRLISLARQKGIRRLVFVSSMSAYEGTSQRYGLTKLACERVVLAAGGAVARLGLVYGPNAGGMVGALKKMAHFPVVPAVASKALQYTVHEDDVSSAVVKLVIAPKVPTVPLCLAHPRPVTFGRVLHYAVAEGGGRAHFVPVPWSVLYGGLRATEALGRALPFRSDSLLGLVRAAPAMANQDAVHTFGLEARPFPF